VFWDEFQGLPAKEGMFGSERWQGPADFRKLSQMAGWPKFRGVVWSLMHRYTPEQIIPVDELIKERQYIESFGLRAAVFESLPIPISIQINLPDRDRHIEIFKQNLKNLAAAGIGIVTINFMGQPDWCRDPEFGTLPGEREFVKFTPSIFRKLDHFQGFALPGATLSSQGDDLRRLFDRKLELGKEGLLKEVERFLSEIAPLANELKVKLAIHPDDPGPEITIDDLEKGKTYVIPGVMCEKESFDRAVETGKKFGDSNPVGLCFCVGSLGTNPGNTDIPGLATHFMKQVFFCHFRDVNIEADGSFRELPHEAEGRGNLKEVVRRFVDAEWKGPWRSDHGLRYFGEEGLKGYWPLGGLVSQTVVQSWIDAFNHLK